MKIGFHSTVSDCGRALRVSARSTGQDYAIVHVLLVKRYLVRKAYRANISYTVTFRMVLKCPKCPAEFTTQRDLERHLAKKNSCDKGAFKCDGCLMPFTSKRTLKEHIKKGRCKGKSLTQVNHDLSHEIEQLRIRAEEHHLPAAATDVEASSSQDVVSLNTEAPLQPPVDIAVAIIDQAGFFEFENKKIRKTSESPQRVSVYDLIAAITDQTPKTAFMKFSRIKESHLEVSTICGNFKFPGSGQKDTPVTNARGVVVIMNLLSGEKAAKFRLASADIIVRYLGGDETLIGEIRRNQEIQETAGETNAVRLFGEAVNAANAVKFHDASSLIIDSATNVQEFRAPQFYFRQILGKWSKFHPTGRPQDVMSVDELAEVAVVKIGSMGVTERQMTHNKQFDRSELLDSCLTSSFTHVETKAKDYWRDRGELYEGLHEGKTVRDTELLIVRNQEDYERHLAVVQQLCERFPYIADQPREDNALELSLAQEKSIVVSLREIDVAQPHLPCKGQLHNKC